MRTRILAVACLAAVSGAWPLSTGGASARRIEFGDLPAALQRRWAGPQPFAEYLDRVDADTALRVAEGEREHLIDFALQSTSFTAKPRIEPALSSRAFVDSLTPISRERLLDEPDYVPSAGWPAAERARVADLLDAISKGRDDVRLAYFARLLSAGGGPATVDALFPDYVRVARFLYKKEFEAADAAEVGELNRTRAHRSDTQIEAGFGVYTGLGAVHALDPALRVKSVLIVGPGLDVAPQTDPVDIAEPQSYQPFAVADALIGLSMSAEEALTIHSVDVNPRVVQYLEEVGRTPLVLHLFSVAETAAAPFSDDYRSYLRQLGRSIGSEVETPAAIASDGRFHRFVRVRPAIARAMTASRVNVITEQLPGGTFDLAIATNVLSYFKDDDLALALVNIAAMVRPGGYLLHNESRAGLVEAATAVRLPTTQMRTVVLGWAKDHPLSDTVWVHQRLARDGPRVYQ
jgi:hypothetical protein